MPYLITRPYPSEGQNFGKVESSKAHPPTTAFLPTPGYSCPREAVSSSPHKSELSIGACPPRTFALGRLYSRDLRGDRCPPNTFLDIGIKCLLRQRPL